MLCSLDVWVFFYFPLDFQLLQQFFQTLVDRYKCCFIFQFSGKVYAFVYLSSSFNFYTVVNWKKHYHYHYYFLIRVFHISVGWWYFTRDWVTKSLLKSPGLFSVFWPFSIMLFFGWSPLGHQLPNLPGPLINL